ncbi:MAG: glycosyltransferase family 2 protein [bacterium]|jgi:glycosyltransferase involved in cell wall biosynthesis|nr:glycosyltransferase family 2 protein [bacterium]
MKASIIIPVYNEAATLETIVARVKKVDLEKEIIIVDDGSIDGTRSILEAKPDLADRILYHRRNKGKGAAIKTALSYVSGDVVIIQDADLEYNPDEYQRLLGPIEKGIADVVYGSRFGTGRPHRVLLFWHYVGNRVITLLSNCFTNLNLTDTETCYKVFTTGLLKSITLEEDRFGFEQEVTIKLARKNARIYEVGISYWGRDYSEGKKITWVDGIDAIYCILKYGFTSLL